MERLRVRRGGRRPAAGDADGPPMPRRLVRPVRRGCLGRRRARPGRGRRRRPPRREAARHAQGEYVQRRHLICTWQLTGGPYNETRACRLSRRRGSSPAAASVLTWPGGTVAAARASCLAGLDLIRACPPGFKLIRCLKNSDRADN